MVITLSWEECNYAAQVGLRRQLTNMRRSTAERPNVGRKTLAQCFYFDVVGAAGEMAAAKALGLYWTPGPCRPQRKDEPDIYPCWQVRTLAGAHYDLIVRPDDEPHFRYVLVTGDLPTFNVVGHILGADAKRPEWVKDLGGHGAPCYCVPQSALILIDDKVANDSFA